MLYDAASSTGRSSYACVTAILDDWRRADDIIRQLVPAKLKGQLLAQSKLRAPVLWPSALYCAGINYRDHAAEMLRQWVRGPEPDPRELLGKPWHFLKAPHSITDPEATVAATGYSQQLD
jgi:2-keto-4-pentenoate hydratase/2-oxohepta-3-ene-1,7-dioic acid hydratase in catechol pathway